MTDKPEESRLLWSEQADGSMALIPAEHESRVEGHIVGLGAAQDAESPLRLLSSRRPTRS